MQDVGANAMHSTAAPRFFRVGEYLWEAFMIAIEKQDGIRQLRQRIQLVLIMPAQPENAPKVTGDDQHIILVRCYA